MPLHFALTCFKTVFDVEVDSETTLVLTGAAPHGSEEQDLAGIAKVCRELAHQEVLSKPLQLLLGALERGQISAEHARRSASAMRGQVVPELRKAG